MIKVLIVDDSALMRRQLSQMFASAGGFEVCLARNGAEGVEQVRVFKPNVVTLDINMPVMNGLEFMKHIHGDEQLKGTPVIVVSTEGSEERKVALHDLGIRAYLRKPVSPECLVETITRIFGEIPSGRKN